VRATPSAAAIALLLAALGAAPATAHTGNAAGGIGSGLLAPGDSFQLSLDGPGTYEVHCHLHANMVGQLVVLAGTGPEGPRVHRVELRDGTDVLGGSFYDTTTGTSRTTAFAGDVVLWTNAGNQTHDVHLAPAVPNDNGTFETVVLAGLAVTLVAIYVLGRR
jgi:plastocyanin